MTVRHNFHSGIVLGLARDHIVLRLVPTASRFVFPRFCEIYSLVESCSLLWLYVSQRCDVSLIYRTNVTPGERRTLQLDRGGFSLVDKWRKKQPPRGVLIFEVERADRFYHRRGHFHIGINEKEAVEFEARGNKVYCFNARLSSWAIFSDDRMLNSSGWLIGSIAFKVVLITSGEGVANLYFIPTRRFANHSREIEITITIVIQFSRAASNERKLVARPRGALLFDRKPRQPEMKN